MNDVFTWPVGRATQQHGLDPIAPAPFLPVGAYVAACSLSGTAMALVLALGGAGVRALLSISATTVLAVGLPVALLASHCQWAGHVRPLPERRAQVPKRWLQWPRRTTTAAAFGLVIGAGALTYLWHATAWVLALVILAAPTWGTAAVCGAIYGATRGMGLLVTFVLDQTRHGRPNWDAIWMGRTPATLGLAPLGLATYVGVMLVVA